MRALAALTLACCGGGLSGSPAVDGGAGGDDGGSAGDVTLGSGSSSGNGGSSSGSTSSGGSTSSSGGTGTGDDSSSQAGGGAVDAGLYYGDGSFWVDGGAYPGLNDSGGVTDAEPADASSGCSALAACCATLNGSAQALCNSVVQSGNDANCDTEMTQLQAEGYCTGVTILASLLQVTPSVLASDGTLLFFLASPGLYAVPVQGGPITTLLTTVSPYGASFLAVDAVNVYILDNNSLVRIPKDGSPPTLVNEAGAVVQVATSLGGTAYWVEQANGINDAGGVAVKSAPLLGNTVDTIAPPFADGPFGSMAVTSSTVFLNNGGLEYFPLSGIPAGGPTQSANNCFGLTSDTDAIYCSGGTGTNLRIASDGSATTLGPAVNSSYIVSDNTSAYWTDQTTVGTVMKAPKAGGGTATIIARDTNPGAIAVDAHSVYWGDQNGFIKSIAK